MMPATAVSVSSLQKLVDSGDLTPEEIAAKVKSGEIEIHDDRVPTDSPSYRGTAEGRTADAARTHMDKMAKGGDLPAAGRDKPLTLEDQARSLNPFGNPFDKRTWSLATGAGKGAISTAYHVGKMIGVIEPNAEFENALKSENAGQFAGKAIEQGAEFFGGEAAIKGVIKAAEVVPAVAKVVEGAPKIVQFFGRAARRFGTGYGVTRAEGGSPQEATTTGALSSGFAAAVELLGGVAKSAGMKVLNSAIRPTATDLNDGFKTETVLSEGLDTSNLATLHDSAAARLNELRDAAKDIRANASTQVDVLQPFIDAKNELLSDWRYAAKSKTIEKIADDYITNISHKAPTGIADVADANALKTGLGFSGEWSHGASAPDAQVESLFASKAYKYLNRQITEQVGTAGPRLAYLNGRMQALIPVMRAVARRIPVEARNNPLGLIKAMAFVTGDYKVLLADIAQRNLATGAAAARAGDVLVNGAGALGAGAAGAEKTQQNEMEQ